MKLIALTLAALFAAQAAQAQSIVATPSSSVLQLGQTVAIDFNGVGFDDATFGGGFSLSYDPGVVELTGITIPSRWEFFRSAGLHDPASGSVSDLSFNTFNPLGGDFLTATATFRAIGLGTSAIALTASNDFPFAKSLGQEIKVSFQGATISAVPEPGSLTLLLAGVVGVGALRAVQRRARG